MTKNNNHTALIVQLQKILESWRRQAVGISSDASVLHWQKVNIESFSSVLASLNLNSTSLRRARDNYPDITQRVLQRVSFLANELHNLESDIKLGPVAPEHALAAAQKIEEQCKELKPDIDKLANYHKLLVEGSKILKEKLDFKTFLPQARQNVTGKKKAVFETGYTIYRTVSDEQEGLTEDEVVNMFTYFDKASRLLTSIDQTDIPPLPALATSHFNLQLRLCREGCEQVKFFITFVSDFFRSESQNIQGFQDNLNKLKQQSLTELLLEIPSQTENAARCIQAFANKKFLMEEIDKVNFLITCIETFYDILITTYLPYIASQVEKKNGLLNPQTMAIANSKQFFNGMRGLWRLVRMLLFSLGSTALISQDELEEKVEEAIRTCAFFFKPHGTEGAEINDFLEEFCREYNSPFPHDELLAIMKKSIITYATVLEKVFARFKDKGFIPSEDELNLGGLSLGRLASKIDIQTGKLHKFRLKFENNI